MKFYCHSSCRYVVYILSGILRETLPIQLQQQSNFDEWRNIGPPQMKWEDLAKQLTDAAEGNGKCQFAAIHSLEDGSCLGKYPKEVQGVKSDEMALLSRAFKDPTMLYSSGILLKDVKFTYVKIEGNSILGRTPTTACLIMQTDKAYIVCIYPGEELARNVHKNCMNVFEKMKEI